MAKKRAPRNTAPGRRVSKPTVDVYAASTVLPGERVQSYARATDWSVEEQARRFTQWVAMYGQRNASDCATQTLRLYTKGSTGNAMQRSGYATRAVTDRNRARYLRDHRRVGKVATYAESAGDITEILESPILDTLRRPNPWEDQTEFFTNLYLSGEFAGNLYLCPLFPESPDEKMQFTVLQPQWVRVIPDETRFISGYTYGRNRVDVVYLDTENLYHKKLKPNPWNPYYGASPILPLLMEADIDSASTTRDLAMWNNGARPDFMVLMPPEAGSNQTQFDQLVENLNARHGGPQNAGIFKVSNGTSIVPLQFTPRDMENMERTHNLERRIAFAFDFPETMAKLNDASRANGNTGDVQRARYGIEPRIRSMAEFLTRYIPPRFDLEDGEVWFAYDNCVPQDDAAIAAVQVSLYNAAIVTLNESRAELGYDPMPDGDELKELPDPNPPVTGPANDRDKGRKATANHHDKAASAVEPALSHETDRLFERLKEAVEAWVIRVSKRLNETNVTTLLRSPEVQAEFRAVVDPYIMRLFRVGVSAGVDGSPLPVPGDGVTDPLSIVPERGAKWLDGYSFKLAGEVTETMQDDLRQAISDAITQGKPMAEATVDAANALKDGSGVRAELIAVTETSRAVQEGEQEAWKAIGIEKWLWIPSADACPLCLALAEKCNADGGWPVGQPIIKVGEGFEVGGKMWTNKYIDIRIAQAHPRCRCSAAAVV